MYGETRSWETNCTLGNHAVISDSQHGLTNESSCLPSLLDFFAQVTEANDTENNKAVDLVYLNFQKSLDTVPHERLISKVNAHTWYSR